MFPLKPRLKVWLGALMVASFGVIGYLVASLPFWAEKAIPGHVDERSIAASLIASNSRYAFKDGTFRRGMSTIHRLDEETASRVDEALHRVAARTGLPVNYLAAYVQQESTGDPRAEYRNPAQWDAAKDDRERFASGDHGLVQISGRNLLERFPGLSLEEMKLKAEDIDFATDFLADFVVEELKWASDQKSEALKDVDKDVLPKAKNPYWLAALSYNRGRPGALNALSNPRACRHADLIVAAWVQIDAKAGTGPTSLVKAPVFPAATNDDSRRLAMGEIGSSVEALQRLLNDRITPSPALKVDGNFGPATRDALVRFQRTHTLEPTGITDAKTWTALLGSDEAAPGSGGFTPLVMGDIGNRVVALQRRINDRLHPETPLSTDGRFGAATRDALIRFQRSRKIAPTGAADLETIKALDSPAGP